MANQTESDHTTVNGSFHLKRWRVYFDKAWKYGTTSSSVCEMFLTFSKAKEFANNLANVDFRNKYFGEPGWVAYNISVFETGKYRTPIPFEEWSELSESIDNFLADESGETSKKCKDDDLVFFVEHARVPKPTQIHEEHEAMFVSDKFSSYNAAKDFAWSLINRKGSLYAETKSKTHWFFNINIFSVQGNCKTLMPLDDWCPNDYNNASSMDGIFSYCSEVAGIKGERDILREELRKTQAELQRYKSTIREIADQIGQTLKPLSELVG